jgi:hypothetical protein
VHLDYSEDVAGFLRDVMEAVPGMIVAPGLAVQDSWSEVRGMVFVEVTAYR